MALNLNKITYTWSFANTLECYLSVSGHSDVVKQASYYLTATTGSYSVTSGGSVSFPLPSSGSTFIPYQDLTKEILQTWAEQQLGTQVDDLKLRLNSQLESLIAPSIEDKSVPW
jgi:hypothetical protein